MFRAASRQEKGIEESLLFITTKFCFTKVQSVPFSPFYKEMQIRERLDWMHQKLQELRRPSLEMWTPFIKKRKNFMFIHLFLF